MKLTDARKTLEEHLAWMQSTYDEPEPPRPDQETLYEAMETAISVLPRQSGRQTVNERFDYICKAIESANGRTPFGTRSRDKEIVCWRQCVWRLLKQEGYPNLAIARATGWDHATVWWGLDRLTSYLQGGDPLATATWEELNRILK